MFVPNIDTLRNNFSSFAARGAEPSMNFASRFGGYTGTPFIAQQFRSEPDEGFKRAIPDSKRYANAFNIDQEETVKSSAPESTYTPPSVNEPTVSTIPKSFISNLTASQSYVQRTESDESMVNAAATLKATENTATTAVQNPIFDPVKLRSLIDSYGRGSFNVGLRDPANESYREIIAKEDTTMPMVDDYSVKPQDQTKLEPQAKSMAAENTSAEIKPQVVMPEPKPQEQPTYTRSSAADKQPDTTPKMNDRNFIQEAMDDIEGIDVQSSRGSAEDLEGVDVQSSRRSAAVRRPDNPWERFKELYVDFYTGGRGEDLLQEFNRREDAGEFNDIYNNANSMSNLNKKSYTESSSSVGNMNRDTNVIMQAKNERDELVGPYQQDMMDTNNSRQFGSPTIINNNQTFATNKTNDGSRTSRVFSDDSTFNRHASADMFHPNR